MSKTLTVIPKEWDTGKRKRVGENKGDMQRAEDELDMELDIENATNGRSQDLSRRKRGGRAKIHLVGRTRKRQKIQTQANKITNFLVLNWD